MSVIASSYVLQSEILSHTSADTYFAIQFGLYDSVTDRSSVRIS